MLVSFFTNKLLPADKHTDIIDQFNEIREGKYQMLIDDCRLAVAKNDQILYKKLKEQLPAITFCGTFENQRKANQISNYNKLLILDIDHIDDSNIQSQKNLIKNDPYTFCCFLSPSGKGLKFLVKIFTTIEYHKQAFKALSKYYKDKYQIEIDKSGSDCSRLCYVSHDPELYVNLAANIFEFSLGIEYIKEPIKLMAPFISKIRTPNRNATIGYNKQDNRKIISQIITFLRKNKYSITETHEKWYKCAYSIANTFTFDLGKKYFIELSKLDGENYDEVKSNEMIEYCYKNRNKNGLKFTTIIYYVQEKGFVIKNAKKNARS